MSGVPCAHEAWEQTGTWRKCLDCDYGWSGRKKKVAPPPEWLVAYAPCRCVRAIRALGYGKPGEDDFRREFPAAVAVVDWPQIRCRTHHSAPVVAS